MRSMGISTDERKQHRSEINADVREMILVLAKMGDAEMRAHIGAMQAQPSVKKRLLEMIIAERS